MTNVTDMPRPRDGILDIAAYVPGKSSGSGSGKVHKLSSNESPLGPSPAAMQAYAACARDLAQYPDGSSAVLRDALAKAHESFADDGSLTNERAAAAVERVATRVVSVTASLSGS